MISQISDLTHFYILEKKFIKKIYETPPAFFVCLIHTKYNLNKPLDKVYRLLQDLIVIAIR